MMGDLLVRGGTVVDGAGSPAVREDVRVHDGRIVEVAANLRAEGEEVLDAGGAYVTPGFIDIHTHFDPSLCWDPFADPMPQHGVTTVLIGNCSLSLAPTRPEHRSLVGSTFGFIEDFPDSAFATDVPWSWVTYPDYAKDLASR